MPFLQLLMPFLQANWKPILLGILVISVLSYIGILKHEVSSKQQEIEHLQLDLQTTKDNNEKLMNSIAAVNDTLKTIDDSNKDIKKQFDGLNVAITKSAQDLKGKIDGIGKEVKPVTCQETIKYLIDAKSQYAK